MIVPLVKISRIWFKGKQKYGFVQNMQFPNWIKYQIKNFSHYLKLIFHCFEILDKNCEFVTLRGCLWSERPPRQLVQVQINCRHNSYLLNSSFKENALRIPSDEKRGCVLYISFLIKAFAFIACRSVWYDVIWNEWVICNNYALLAVLCSFQPFIFIITHH